MNSICCRELLELLLGKRITRVLIQPLIPSDRSLVSKVAFASAFATSVDEAGTTVAAEGRATCCETDALLSPDWPLMRFGFRDKVIVMFLVKVLRTLLDHLRRDETVDDVTLFVTDQVVPIIIRLTMLAPKEHSCPLA